MSLDPLLRERAELWRDEDPDDVSRAELQALLAAAAVGDEGAVRELTDAFTGRLTFGTAGLRGPLGAGPNRMNSVVVARAAAGLASYLQSHGGGSVVIGHDARQGSAPFAEISARVLTGAGLDVLRLPAHAPTPLLAFAIRHLSCAAGVMVTASHNPSRDNGYKVYLGDGMQIVPPADAEISTRIAEATALGPIDRIPRGGPGAALDDTVLDAYVRATVTLVNTQDPVDVRMAYTPLHGVGASTFLRVTSAAGLREPLVVASQASPDPAFGGMPFPNPEEPGVMDAVLALAESHGCDLAIAHDPDADRCAIGVPTPSGWRLLTGDEVGWILGWWTTQQPARSPERHTLAQSIVSGSLLRAIAADARVPYEQTLTGFKWIARVPGLAFGYEEALGYCVNPAAVSDKDGISAGLVFADLVGRLARDGRTVLDVLDDLAMRHGVHATGQVSVRHASLERIEAVMARLRTSPPPSIGGMVVERIDDLERPNDGLPPTDGLRFILAGGGRVIVRPSGTEAKIKSYIEVRVPVEAALTDARHRATLALEALAVDLRALLD
jgi:phosphomannomutase